MRLIDADVLAELLKREAELHESDELFERSYGVLDAYMDVLGAPTIDAVHVIRCKDCKYYIGGRCYNWRSVDDWRGEDEFCSRGERREEDGTDN